MWIWYFECNVCSSAYWNGVPGSLGLTPGTGGLGEGGLGIPGLLCSPALSRGEWGEWTGSDGWLEDVWLGDRQFDITGLTVGPPVFPELRVGMYDLLRRLLRSVRTLFPRNWLPPVLRGQVAGPLRANLFSNFSHMGRVAGDWTDTAGRGLQSLLSLPPVDAALLLWRVFFWLGRGGGGGLGDEGLCRWEAKGRGGTGPLLISLRVEEGETETWGFLGSGLVGILLCDGTGGGVTLWKPALESWRSWLSDGTGGGG